MIALIPARGGSRRVPRKNIIPFFGHPMLAYTIAAAQHSGLFSRIVVSTEDAEIAAVASDYGAETVWRPDDLADDRASLVDVTLHALTELRAGRDADQAFCQLMPNCPLRRGSDIVSHWRAFNDHRRSFQISAVNFRSAYPHWSLDVDDEGKGQWFFGENLIGSQDLRRLVCPTGAIWWARTRDFIEQRRFYGSPFHVEMIDANRGLDIDTPEDLELCEVIARGLRDRDGVDPLENVTALRRHSA